MTTRAGRARPASRCTPTSPGCRRTTSTRSTSRPTEKAALLVDWTAAAAAPRRASSTRRASLQQVQENKFYADLAGTRTTQQRVRVQPRFEAMGTDAATGVFDSMRIDRAAGRPRLGVPHRRHARLRLGRRARRGCPSCWPRSCAAPSVEAGRLRPGHPPVQPVADHPRVDRPRHRAGPRARLRGQLRRHLVRDRRPARHAAVRLRRHERHRRPHRRARPGHDRLRRRGRRRRRAGTSSATACWSATSSTGRWPRPEARSSNGGRSNGCAYADSPGHIPIQRMANVSLQPAPDGPLDRRADRPASSAGSTSSATSPGRSTCSATTSSSPASGSTGSRTAGSPARSATSPTRPPPRTSGARWRRSAARDLGARRCLQLRQGAARPGRGGQPRLPHRRCSATSTSSTPPHEAGQR